LGKKPPLLSAMPSIKSAAPAAAAAPSMST
jgi:hypothetical protein